MGELRSALECPLCGAEAIMADDQGFFWESSDWQPCLSCGYPGRVMTNDPEENAWWLEAPDDHVKVKAWRGAYPAQAAELDAIGYISQLPSQGDQ